MGHIYSEKITPEVLCALVEDTHFAQIYAQTLLENYDDMDIPALTALATAHKIRQYKNSFYGEGKDLYPKLADCATYFFEALFPEKDSNYYKVINGLVKWSPELDETQMRKFEYDVTEPEEVLKRQQIKKLKEEINQLQVQLDILEKL